MTFFWLFFLAIPLSGFIYGYFTERLKSQERIKAMEKGLPLPPETQASNPWTVLSKKTPWDHADDLRLGGLICVAVGAGLTLLFWALAYTGNDPAPKALMAVGAIPGLVGAVLLYEGDRRTRILGPRPPTQPPVPKP